MSTIAIAKELGHGIFTEAEAAIATGEILSSMISDVAGETLVNQNMVPENTEVSLGTLEKPFKDVFISESSLYVNGTKVLSEDAGTINISADENQNISISTSGSGDIEFAPVDSGVIQLKGSVSVTAGKQIISSDGNAIVIGEDLNVQVITSPTITLIDGRLASLETLTTSDDINIDTIQEIVDFIKANRTDLESIVLDWSAIENVPATFTPTAHSHDDTYYTKSEVDTAVSGATMAAGDILTAIKTVDGAGSGLDSDLLDGQTGTYYATAANVNTKAEMGTSAEFNSAFDTALV